MSTRLDTNSSAVRKRIEKHKFDNEEGEEYSSSRFGDFSEYFRRKKIKLQNLDEELRSSSLKDNSPIFRGVVAHVIGYTQPSLKDLRTLIVTHGGGFLQYFDGKTASTHIIASNLTPKKKVEFRRYRIVKPAWVVDSVNAGKQLPWDGYKVVDEGIGQQLLAFDNGNVVSQAGNQQQGYRDQTKASWYTEQIKNYAHDLDGDTLEQSFHRAQSQSCSGNNCDYDDQVYVEQETHTQNIFHSLEISESQDIGAEFILKQEGPSNGITPTLRLNPKSSPVRTDHSGGLPQKEATHSTQDLYCPQKDSIQEGISNNSPATDQFSEPIDHQQLGPIMTAEDHNAALLADPKIWKSTVVNPGFLKQYYEESRLHHLSTWKADLKSQLQALAAENPRSREKCTPESRRYILHVDFDSFFASVSLKNFPQYVDLPVAVAHGGGSGSEIASCNYPARTFGVKNGMWMNSAKILCPDLKVLPYDFKAYEEASRKFYAAILDVDGIVQSVSVDEALVDVSKICVAAGRHGGGVQEGSIWREQVKADEVAHGLRDEIKERTGCAVSVGIGGSILLAKVALRKAKPAGQYHVKSEEALEFLGGLPVRDLPGVAYSIGGKLEEIGVEFVKDVRELSKERLLSTLGPKTGEKIWNYSRGIDNVEVGEQVIRKSVSAEVNWGIRFVTQNQVDEFLQSLCEELHNRLVNENVKGQQLNLKVMRRAAKAPLNPPKYLGHGKCHTYNKSINLGVATNEKDVLGREAVSIMRGWSFPPGELRGIGVQITKLEPLKGLSERTALESQKRLPFKASASPKTLKQENLSSDKLDSRHKPRASVPNLTSSLAPDVSPSGKRRPPLNTLGTQFVLPTQTYPEVLAKLPGDIRATVLQKKSTKVLVPLSNEEPTTKARANSTALPADALPARSQLDQDTLDALPSDVRAEILAFYETSPENPPSLGPLPLSPRQISTMKCAPKKTSTPTKKRATFLSRSKISSKVTPGLTLTQSSFASHDILNPPNHVLAASSEISPEFLSALPEDIRREVLDQARRDRLKKCSGIALNVAKKPTSINSLFVEPPPPGQRFLQLLPRPPKPTFTAQKFSTLPALRDSVSAWFEEFSDEGPYADDVDALVRYLKKVVEGEGDINKAVSMVKWLEWVIWEAEGAAEQWRRALGNVQSGVQEAVKARGLGRILF